MSNPLQGWNIIPRASLHSMIQESARYEMQLRERRSNAIHDFYDQTKNVNDTRSKVKIMKEVAKKYGFRESWFIEQIRLYPPPQSKIY